MARASTSRGLQSPVLLLGAGRGEATCGILYIAGYLRRNGIEAFVRHCDWDQTEQELEQSLAALMKRVKPKVVGISLKWYLHVHRALVIARALRKIDPDVRIVLGGNTAALWWRELLAHDCVDDVLLGDGEAPMLALCRGLATPPNWAHRGDDGAPVKEPFGYVQTEASEDVYYSHFKDIFLSELDVSGFSGWVAPGKGCDQSCVYCGGRRAAQRLSFGRPNPFLRSNERVRQDHREIAPLTWQFRYDFPGGSTDYMCDVWRELELSKHCTTYFLWGVPAKRLVESLAKTFDKVALVLDIGCFSQTQRDALMGKGVLKPCPSDVQLMESIADCLQYSNVELEVCGIAGLPMITEQALTEERALVERMLERGAKVGYQRLQSQPGALVTEHPERFDMVSEASSFDEFLQYFSKRTAATRGKIPMVRCADGALEKAVQRNCAVLDSLLAADAAKRAPRVAKSTRLVATTVKRSVQLGAWLGEHKVPPRSRAVEVTVLRSANGAGMACAPGVDDFDDPMVEVGDAAAAILATLGQFSKSTPVESAVGRLVSQDTLDPDSAMELIDHLVSKRFLERR